MRKRGDTMTVQPELFDEQMYSPLDPYPSMEAAMLFKKSGRKARHEEIAIRAVWINPSMTYAELWERLSDDDRKELGNQPVALQKRLSGLLHRRLPILKHGPHRVCSVKKSIMVVWEMA